MKKILVQGMMAVMLIATSAPVWAQQVAPIDYRKTLFAPFGQVHMIFEAPDGMCFLDQTRPGEAAYIHDMQQQAKKRGKEVLVAVFVNCMDSAGMRMGALSPENATSTGFISWMNPYVGEKTDMSRQDYLDMRESSFLYYMQADAERFVDTFKKVEQKQTGIDIDMHDAVVLDSAARRTAQGVMLGYTVNKHLDSTASDLRLLGVSATTQLRGFPIEVHMQMKSDTPADALPGAYDLMDKFLLQQIVLNEND